MVQKAKTGRSGVQRLRRVKVKICDFKKVSQIQPEFRKAVGLCDREKRTIWIDSSLPKRNEGTGGVILQHEKAHMMLHDLGIKWGHKIEERFCYLFALVTASKNSLSSIEAMFREKLRPMGRIYWVEIIMEAHGHGAKTPDEYRRWQSDGNLIECHQ